MSKSEYDFLPPFCRIFTRPHVSIELLSNPSQLPDEQTYLLLTILLTFSEVGAFLEIEHRVLRSVFVFSPQWFR